jgi:hypothetical protein
LFYQKKFLSNYLWTTYAKIIPVKKFRKKHSFIEKILHYEKSEFPFNWVTFHFRFQSFYCAEHSLSKIYYERSLTSYVKQKLLIIIPTLKLRNIFNLIDISWNIFFTIIQWYIIYLGALELKAEPDAC